MGEADELRKGHLSLAEALRCRTAPRPLSISCRGTERSSSTCCDGEESNTRVKMHGFNQGTGQRHAGPRTMARGSLPLEKKGMQGSLVRASRLTSRQECTVRSCDPPSPVHSQIPPLQFLTHRFMNTVRAAHGVVSVAANRFLPRRRLSTARANRAARERQCLPAPLHPSTETVGCNHQCVTRTEARGNIGSCVSSLAALCAERKLKQEKRDQAVQSGGRTEPRACGRACA